MTVTCPAEIVVIPDGLPVMMSVFEDPERAVTVDEPEARTAAACIPVTTASML